ncbi:MAG: DUF2551 domain-containing protein [Methanobacteriota archaeon]
MIYQDKRHDIVEERLRSWLDGDQKGIRHEIIRIFLCRSDLSIQEIYEHLSYSFQISYHSVSGMVGIISSRIGILTGIWDAHLRCRLYRIRERDMPVVRRIISM